MSTDSQARLEALAKAIAADSEKVSASTGSLIYSKDQSSDQYLLLYRDLYALLMGVVHLAA